MTNATNELTPADLSSARAVIGLSTERAHEWCVKRRPSGLVDAHALAAKLAETVGGRWWDVLDLFETRRIAACRASKLD
jgi:hypothetical protein